MAQNTLRSGVEWNLGGTLKEEEGEGEAPVVPRIRPILMEVVVAN